MPIDTKHADYKANEDRWQLCRDFNDGEKAVKDAGKKYLPGLSGQTANKYKAYKDRALFFNAAGRTTAALTGLVYQKSPAVVLPKALEYLIEDATGTGITLTELLISTTMNILITGRAGLLADRDGEGKPYLVLYDETDVTNWKIDGSDDQFVVLRELYSAPSEKDKYIIEEKTRFRELKFSDGEYSVDVWEAPDGASKKRKGINKGYVVKDQILPTIGGKPLEFVPFTIITPNGLDYEVDKSPIEDMCRLQNKHYSHAADYSSALRTICLPTPVIVGMSPQDEGGKDVTINLGPDTAIILPDVGSKASFLEFSGNGIDSVEDALTKIEGMLAALGAKLIEPQVSNTRETAEGTRSRDQAAAAIMHSIIASVELAFTRILKDIATWENTDTSVVSVTLNRELVKNRVDANLLIALTSAVQVGTLSPEAFYENLSEAGYYSADSTFEIEKGNIEEYLKKLKATKKSEEDDKSKELDNLDIDKD